MTHHIMITSKQLKKLLNEEPVQFSHANLIHKTVGGSLFEINVSKDLNTKINRAIRNNKGLRISNDHYAGGKIKIMNKIMKAISKPAELVFGNKKVQKVGTSLGDTTNNQLLPAVVTIGKPVLTTTANITGTMLGGPVLGATLSTLANKGFQTYAQPVANRQTNPYLDTASKEFGNLASKQTKIALAGNLKRNKKY